MQGMWCGMWPTGKKKVCSPFYFLRHRLGKSNLTAFEISWTNRKLITMDSSAFPTYWVPWHGPPPPPVGVVWRMWSLKCGERCMCAWCMHQADVRRHKRLRHTNPRLSPVRLLISTHFLQAFCRQRDDSDEERRKWKERGMDGGRERSRRRKLSTLVCCLPHLRLQPLCRLLPPVAPLNPGDMSWHPKWC